MANRIKVNKPTGKEDQSQAILRAIAMKRETYFQGILYNLLRNEKATHETMVTVSGKDGSEHTKVNILDILYNLLRNEKATHETMVTVSGKDGSEHTKVNILDIVDTALEGADYVIEKLYHIKAEATDE